MKNFIAQQIIFLGVTTFLFHIACPDEKKESKQDAKSEWQDKKSEDNRIIAAIIT